MFNDSEKDTIVAAMALYKATLEAQRVPLKKYGLEDQIFAINFECEAIDRILEKALF